MYGKSRYSLFPSSSSTAPPSLKLGMIIFTPPLLPFQCPPGLSGRFPCPSFFSAEGRKAPNSKTTIQGPRPFPFPSPILPPTSTSSSLLFRLLLRAKSSSSPFAVCRSPCAGLKFTKASFKRKVSWSVSEPRE